MNYPYMLIIRNEPNGMIWQAYEVHSELEERLISKTARSNYFLVSREPVGYTAESTPGWRETPEWKKYSSEQNEVCE